MGSEAYARLAEKYPDELKKAKGMYDHDLDMETLTASRPDLILGWKGTFSEKRFKSTAWWNDTLSRRPITFFSRGPLKTNVGF